MADDSYVKEKQVRDLTTTMIDVVNGIESGGGGGPADWDTMIHKPATFPPEAHTHEMADITDYTVPSAADIGLGNVDNTADVDKPVSGPQAQAIADASGDESGQFAVNTVAESGTAVTLPATHPAHKVTLTANCVLSFDAPSGGHAFVLSLSGAFTPTFPATVRWPDGTAPTYNAAGTLYQFVTLDAGTTWQGTGAAHG